MAKQYYVQEQSFLFQKMWKKRTNCSVLINVLSNDLQLEKENNFSVSSST